MAKRSSGRSYTHEAAQKRHDWFGTADASPDGLADWDIKQEALCTAVLGVLAAGDYIAFGSSMDGGAVSVTIYSGDTKLRKWVSDSVEFDDLMVNLARRAAAVKAND